MPVDLTTDEIARTLERHALPVCRALRGLRRRRCSIGTSRGNFGKLGLIAAPIGNVVADWAQTVEALRVVLVITDL